MKHFYAGDMLTNQEAKLCNGMLKLWDMLSEAVEGSHIRPEGERYQALVKQMVKLAGLHDKNDPELEIK